MSQPIIIDRKKHRHEIESLKATSSLQVLGLAKRQSRATAYGLQETRDSLDVERVEVHDTITITKTITVQTNDKGDTLRVNTETDRERIRSKADVRRQKVETKAVRDTVYVERTDSSLHRRISSRLAEQLA